jgi:hypothetical protein
VAAVEATKAAVGAGLYETAKRSGAAPVTGVARSSGDGSFWFIAHDVIAEMSPSQRAKYTFIGGSH